MAYTAGVDALHLYSRTVTLPGDCKSSSHCVSLKRVSSVECADRTTAMVTTKTRTGKASGNRPAQRVLAPMQLQQAPALPPQRHTRLTKLRLSRRLQQQPKLPVPMHQQPQTANPAWKHCASSSSSWAWTMGLPPSCSQAMNKLCRYHHSAEI